jgi:hypothetical protein
MSTILILFFISLAGIMAMIGRKMVVLSGREAEMTQHLSGDDVPVIPFFEDMKNAAGKNAKKYGYIGLVLTLRTYFKSTNFIKKKAVEAKDKVKSIGEKSKIINTVKERGEASKFLELVTDYKHKLRKIKKEIQDEEESL